ADLEAGARLLMEKESLTPEDFPALLPLAPVAVAAILAAP
ncbi:hypothetical protein, partial [Pseudomonas corrugata]